MLVTFSEDEELRAPYRIENRSAQVAVEFQQKELDEELDLERLGPGETLRWAPIEQLLGSRKRRGRNTVHGRE